MWAGRRRPAGCSRTAEVQATGGQLCAEAMGGQRGVMAEGGHQRDVRSEEAVCVWLGSGLCASDVAGRKRPVLEGEWLQ